MRRIILMLTVAALMVAMMALSAVPALAQGFLDVDVVVVDFGGDFGGGGGGGGSSGGAATDDGVFDPDFDPTKYEDCPAPLRSCG